MVKSEHRNTRSLGPDAVAKLESFDGVSVECAEHHGSTAAAFRAPHGMPLAERWWVMHTD